MAERGGFEPPVRFNPYSGLANRRLQPLGHLSPDPVGRKKPREIRAARTNRQSFYQIRHADASRCNYLHEGGCTNPRTAWPILGGARTPLSPLSAPQYGEILNILSNSLRRASALQSRDSLESALPRPVDKDFSW